MKALNHESVKTNSREKVFSFVTFFLFTTVFFFSTFLITKAVTVSPPRQMAVVKFGESEEVTLIVENNEVEEKFFVPSVDAFTIDSKSGTAIFGQDDVAFNWIKITPENLKLQPGEKGEFTFTISIPEDADSGGHYLGLFASEQGGQGPTNSAGRQVALGSRVGSLLFLYSEGDIREDLVKVDFSTNKKVLFSGSMEVGLKMKNVGNIHLIPWGEIVISQGEKELKKIELNENERKVLPGDFWQFDYLIEDLNWKNFGKIKIVLKNNYGVSNKIMLDSVDVWYLPWPILLVISVSILFCVFVFIFVKKKNFFKSKK